MICHLGPPWCDLLCGLGQGLEIYKIYLLVVIINDWGCFASQKARTKIEELRDLSIEEFTNDYLQMTNLDTLSAPARPAGGDRQGRI